MYFLLGYQETYFLYCITSNIKEDETKPKYATPIAFHTPGVTSTKPTHILTQEKDNDDYLHADPIATTKTNTWMTNAPCHHLPPTRPWEKTTTKCPYAMPKTTRTSRISSKIIKCITSRSTAWTTKPYPVVQITPKSLSTTTTEKTKCCNIPMTWLTTTENIIPVSFLPFESVEKNVIIESEKDITPTKDHIVIVDVTMPDRIVIKDVTDPPTTTDKPLNQVLNTNSPITKTPIKNISTTKKQHYTQTTGPVVTKETDIVVISKEKPSKPTHFKSTLRSTEESVTEIKELLKQSEKTSEKISPDKSAQIVVLKLTEEWYTGAYQYDTKPSTRWYPKLCPSNKCQRPKVWTTTAKSRKHRRN